MSDGPEQTTAETVRATEEVPATESAVPEFAAAEPAAGEHTPAAEAESAAEPAPAATAVSVAAEEQVGEQAGQFGDVEAVVVETTVIETVDGPDVVVETVTVEAVEAVEAVAAVEAVEVAEAVDAVDFAESSVEVAEPEVVVEAVVVESAVPLEVAEAVETSAPAEASAPAEIVVDAVVIEAVAIEATPTEDSAVVPPSSEASLVESALAAAPASDVVAAAAEADTPVAEPFASESVAPTTVSAEPVSADPVASSESASPESATSELTAPSEPAVLSEPAAPSEPAVPEPVYTGPAASQWGRVTEEGTVFAIAADGTEREIGNWAAGTPTDGLAFYERKFASLKGEVDLLNKRVHGPGLSAKDAEATIVKLREQLTDAHAIGDLAGLSARLDKIGRIAEQKQAARKEARAKLQAEAAVTKEVLVSEAEGLAESQQWKSAGERLRVLVDEWKAAPRLDRKADDELWSRFAAARGTFAKRRKAHFAQLDAQRDEVKGRKEDLVAEAESLADSTDWADTAQRFRNLMQQWKTAGRAQRETEDKLWGRFKTAQDTFFAARNADLDQRDAGFKENGVAKEALLAEAQKLIPVTDVKTAKAALRSIHTRWESIGMVPREDKGRIEGALRDVERAVSDAEQAEWKRTNPEARARAQATVDQLRTSISKFEKELARATEAGQAKKIADAEAAIAARQEWLAQAQAALDEFTR